MQELKIFINEEMDLSVRTMLNADGSISVNAEDTAIGFGWTQEKNGKLYVKWERVNGYCAEFGFSPQVGKDDYIPESLFYRLGMKANNDRANKFQNWLAMEVIPSIRKTGGYVSSDELFLNTYLPYADEQTRAMFRTTLQTVRAQNETIKRQREEIEHKEDVIVGLVDDISLAEKRQILNRVVRYNRANYRERWSLLYREFENKYHIDLQSRFDRYNSKNKPKCKTKLEYIDRVMGKIPELYEIAAKLFENDVKELVEEMYEILQ